MEISTNDIDIKVIAFYLGKEIFGVNIQQVHSIERLQEITIIPKSPEFVKGIISLRGSIIPVIDLKERLEMGEIEYSESIRLIIVSIKDCLMGLIVDSANEVIDIKADDVESAPNVIGSINKEYIQGIAKLEKCLLILLNLEKVLSFEEIQDAKAIVEESEENKLEKSNGN